MEKCPHCGSAGYYRKVRFSGQGVMQYRFDGDAEKVDNTSLHDWCNYHFSKTRYCSDCHKAIREPKAKPSNSN